MKERFSKSVGAIILSPKKDKVLIMLQAKEGYWVFPKGKVEKGETETATLRREIREEVGVTEIAIQPRFRESIYFDFKLDKETLIHREVIYYLVTAKNMHVQLDNDEATEFCW